MNVRRLGRVLRAMACKIRLPGTGRKYRLGTDSGTDSGFGIRGNDAAASVRRVA
jgi:hypothetical protein